MWMDDSNPWDAGASYDQPRTSTTEANTLATAGQAVDNTSAGTSLGAWFSGVGSKLVDYAIVRDAAKSSTELAVQRQQAFAMPMQPIAPMGGLGISPNLLLIGGVVVVAALLLSRGKG
jgi:hypothetical protein